jgi:hypothetical protein
MVALDVDNPYARLGVSPLAPQRELKRVINDQTAKQKKEARFAKDRRDEETEARAAAEIARLQAIETAIGNPEDRLAFDRQNPQNVVLTVQPGPDDDLDDPARLGALVSAWVASELPDVWVPAASCIHLWQPDRALLAALDAPTLVADTGPSPDDLDRLSTEPPHG